MPGEKQVHLKEVVQNSGFNAIFSYMEERKGVCGGWGGLMGKVCKQREVSKADLSCVFSVGERFLTCR